MPSRTATMPTRRSIGRLAASAPPTRYSGFVIRHASTSNSAAPASTESTRTTASRQPVRRRRKSDVVDVEGADLVAPPDPVSNIRPIIYASPTPSLSRTPNSPYSTSEFPTSTFAFSSGASKLADLELEWKLRRERVDAVNHRFWSTMNNQFSAQLQHRLSLLPPPSTPPTAEDERRREDCLSQFYADWQAAKRDEMRRWVWGWWREVWDGLRVQGKVYRVKYLGR